MVYIYTSMSALDSLVNCVNSQSCSNPNFRFTQTVIVNRVATSSDEIRGKNIYVIGEFLKMRRSPNLKKFLQRFAYLWLSYVPVICDPSRSHPWNPEIIYSATRNNILKIYWVFQARREFNAYNMTWRCNIRQSIASYSDL